MINQVIAYLKGFSQEQWLWIALAGVILGYIVYNRKEYVNLFDAAVKFITYRTDKLPYPARILIRKFFTRERIKKGIEKALQKFSDVFGTGREIDIEEVENVEE